MANKIHEIYYLGNEGKYVVSLGDRYKTVLRADMLDVAMNFYGSTDKKIVNGLLANFRDPSHQNNIDKISCFPYFERGVYTINGEKVLNTSSYNVIQPDFDSQPTELLDLMHDQLREQFNHVISWFSYFVKSCYNHDPKPGNALYLAGEAGSGKSFFANKIISSVVGGFASGECLLTSQYTSEAFRAPYFVLNDLPVEPGHRNRFTALIKQIVANDLQDSNAKYGAKQQVKWAGRAVITCNLDSVSSEMLPDPTTSDYDKFSLVNVYKGDQIMKYGHAGWEAVVNREAAALCAFLLSWQIPDEIRDVRLGVKAYRHENIVEIVEEKGELGSIIEILKELLRVNGDRPIEGRASDILKLAIDHEKGVDPRLRILNEQTRSRGFGRKLADLSKKVDWITKKSVVDGYQVWNITKPVKQKDIFDEHN